jgi:CRP-like cAMP-binding protein
MSTAQQDSATADWLRSVKLFRKFSGDECSILEATMTHRSINSGQVIFQQGSTGDTFVVVMDGILRVEVTSFDGETATVGTIKPGEVVGEMAVLDPAPRLATVVAATDCEVLELSRDGLLAMRKTAPSVSSGIVSGIIRDITRRLRKANRQIDAQLAPAKERLGRREKPAPVEQAPSKPSLWSRIQGALERSSEDSDG